MRLAGLIIVELAMVAFAWFPGRFIYRTIYVYDQAGIVRTMEWLAFLVPVACFIALPAIAIFGAKIWGRYAGWILGGAILLNILIMVLKAGWFFGGLN